MDVFDDFSGYLFSFTICFDMIQFDVSFSVFGMSHVACDQSVGFLLLLIIVIIARVDLIGFVFNEAFVFVSWFQYNYYSNQPCLVTCYIKNDLSCAIEFESKFPLFC